MATVLSVSGSPSATSRTVRLLRHLDTRRALQGHQVLPLDVRTVPAEALLGADFRHPAIVAAAELFARADGVVIGTPVHKASYSGVLKALLDLLPQYALTRQDRAAPRDDRHHRARPGHRLRPAAGAEFDGRGPCGEGWFTLDQDITVQENGGLAIAPHASEALDHAVDQFSSALGRTAVPAAAG
ncbi:NAD(P)H-dependent oxidoreductase [Streptomyces sp. NPDC051098]|uniref:NAD(P)H-dependent oxidoreductase n=1 Tax=Streptomyces sp. NPDC051098 TaxID=3155411 RepID=UPI00343A8E31